MATKTLKAQKRIRQQLAHLIQRFYRLERAGRKFIPGKTKVRYSGGFFGEQEVTAMLNTILDGWLGLSVVGEKFENRLAAYLRAPYTLATNSGSAATLLTMAALTSRLRPDPLRPGDEVVTPACTFATTVAAIVHQGLVPRFVDVELATLNPTVEHLAAAINKKTRAILIPHTLGNPNDMPKVMKLAREHKLYVVEDNCDGLGSEFNGKKTGSFGHLGAESFYPAHHLTTGGEGGAVIINDHEFYKIVMTLRNWGRGCWCLASEKHPLGACRNRFNYTLEGNIPVDHRYYFSELGYNLKLTEAQAAMGIVQLRRFPKMAQRRRDNFKSLYGFFKHYEKFFYLPTSLPQADPCWFAFPLTLREKVPFSRNEILAYLEEKRIEGRSLFAGNITRHPALRGVNYRVSGSLKNSDQVLKQTFFVGVWPGIGAREMAYMKEIFIDYLKRF
ncbi:MAG: lipopolysaccharide biosynthesis protein RfbH [Candidatus Chisholmbacteria bacterium]|nr:lipopolysaccharide biosynthesis protein RfbH [Candidatus Chisholmbacteria bacterium]